MNPEEYLEKQRFSANDHEKKWLDRGTCHDLFSFGLYEEARDFLLEYLAERPDDTEAQVLLFSTYIKLNDIESAIKEGEKFLAENVRRPKDRDFVQGRLPRLYREVGQEELAQKMEDETLGRTRLTRGGNIDSAEILLRRGDFLAARIEVQKALEKDPEDPKALMFLGQTYVEEGDYEKALIFLQKSFDSVPKKNVSLSLGFCYEQLGNSDRAEDFYFSALQLDPEDSRSYVALARFYENQNDFASAYKYFDQALAKDPENILGNYCFSKLLLKINKTELARTMAKKVIKKDPGFVRAYEVIGRASLKERRYEEARSAFSKIVAKFPSEASWAKALVGKSYLSEGRLQEAKQIYDQMLREDPDLYSTKEGMAQTQMALKNFDLAEKIFSAELQKKPDNFSARYFLAKTLFLKGDVARGQQVLAPLLQKSPIDRGVLYLYAMFVSGENEEFWKSIESVVGKKTVERAKEFRGKVGVEQLAEEEENLFQKNPLWDGTGSLPINTQAAQAVGLRTRSSLKE